MTQTDIDKVRSALAAIEAVLARAPGGAPNDDALLEFRRHCWGILLLAHDPECQDRLDVLVQQAKDLYSGYENAELLRGKIRASLSMLRARLESLEHQERRQRLERLPRRDHAVDQVAIEDPVQLVDAYALDPVVGEDARDEIGGGCRAEPPGQPVPGVPVLAVAPHLEEIRERRERSL